MTKLNITNKRLYKLKKHKNQSKKNVPKKRKNKKRGQRAGRSFRKRRRKYNIKNNSIKNYKKQKGGVKGVKEIMGKSKELQELEKRLDNVQRKIQKLNEEKEAVETKRQARRKRLEANNTLVNKVKKETNEETMDAGIEEIRKLHLNQDDDIKKLSEMQIESIESTYNLEESKPHFDDATRLLEDANAAKITYDKQQKTAAKDKGKLDEQVKNRLVWILQIPLEITKIEKQITKNNKSIGDKNLALGLAQKRQETATVQKEESKIKTAKGNVSKLEKEIKTLTRQNTKLNKELDAKDEELKKHKTDNATDQGKLTLLNANKEKKDYGEGIQQQLQTLKKSVPYKDAEWMKGFNPIEEEKKNTKKEIDFQLIKMLQYAVNKYKKERDDDTRKVAKNAPKIIQKKIDDIALKTTWDADKDLKENEKKIEEEEAKIKSFNEQKSKGFLQGTELVHHTGIKEEIVKQEEADDEAIKKKTGEIVEGLKTGEFGDDVVGIGQQKKVIESRHADTEKAKQELDTLQKTIEDKDKADDESIEKIEGKLKKTQGENFWGLQGKTRKALKIEGLSADLEQAKRDKKQTMGKEAGKLAAATAKVKGIEKVEKDEEKILRGKENWKKGLKGVGSILHKKINGSVIVAVAPNMSRARIRYNKGKNEADKQIKGEEPLPDFKKFNLETTESFRVIEQPFIYDKNSPYAHTTSVEQLKENKGDVIKFHNYYLKKIIKSPDGELPLVEMIAQRMARYINYMMGYQGLEEDDETRQNHRKTLNFLNKKIKELFSPTHLDVPIGEHKEEDKLITETSEFRNHLQEKINALTFLEKLLKETEESFVGEKSQRYVDLMETTIDDQPLFNIFCTHLKKCYDYSISGNLQDIEIKTAEISKKKDDGSEDEDKYIKIGLETMNVVENKPCEPTEDGNDELYMRVAIKEGMELYSKDVLEGEEEEKRNFIDALKKYEDNAKQTEESKKEIENLLPELRTEIAKLKETKYFIDALKEELTEAKKKTHGINVVAKRLEITNNTKHKAEVEAGKVALAESMAKTAAEEEKLKKMDEKAKANAEKLQRREIELTEQVEQQRQALLDCDQTNADEKARMQELLEKKEQELQNTKHAQETQAEEQTIIVDSLKEQEEKKANQEAEGARLAEQEESLRKTRDELLKSDKDEKEEKEEDDDSDEELDSDDLGGIIDEMANRPDETVDVELDPNKDTVVLMARYNKETGQFEIDTRTIDDSYNVRTEIGRFNSGDFQAE